MSEVRRRKNSRKKRLVRSIRKTFISLIFAPLKMPKLNGSILSSLMKFCEGAALLFVFALLAHISSPEIVPTFVVAVLGVVFAGLLFTIKLSDYQEKIEQYKYYGFKI